MVRIVMMYYLNMETFFNRLDADLKIMLAMGSESPPSEAENQQLGLVLKSETPNMPFSACWEQKVMFSGQ